MDPDRKRDWRRGSKSASTSIKPILSDDLASLEDRYYTEPQYIT
jgi:hypothetical protein